MPANTLIYVIKLVYQEGFELKFNVLVLVFYIVISTIQTAQNSNHSYRSVGPYRISRMVQCVAEETFCLHDSRDCRYSIFVAVSLSSVNPIILFSELVIKFNAKFLS